jgi:hypothetical protein
MKRGGFAANIAELPELLKRPQYRLSVAQFVGRRKRPAGVDGGGDSAAAARGGPSSHSGPGRPCARSGRGTRSGRGARSVAREVRAGGLVAESRNHFFDTYKAVVWKDRIVCLAACTKRLLLLLLRSDRRGRHKQCDSQRKYLHNRAPFAATAPVPGSYSPNDIENLAGTHPSPTAGPNYSPATRRGGSRAAGAAAQG